VVVSAGSCGSLNGLNPLERTGWYSTGFEQGHVRGGGTRLKAG
jgi:hypothetical protein